MERGIRLMLAPRSAKAKHFIHLRIVHDGLCGCLSSSNGTSRVQALAWTWVRILPWFPRGTTQVVAGLDPEAYVAAVRECQVADCSTRYNHWLVIRANDSYAGSEVADSRRLRVTRWLVEKGITKVSMMRYQVRIPSQ
ncbi:hypothetical protein Tco_0701911 [Tanacetum coccineum]|uniref:Uncharacterized protein n=1 Tax=Tanacetum coccineum TaxID=301880 RepID=A0ABQ4XW62_9ASTR